MQANRSYRVEAESLARAEAGQLRALLLALDVVDTVLEPPRRPRTENQEGDDGA